LTPRAITGLGVVSTLGVGREAFFAGLASPTLLRDRKPTAVETLDPAKYPNAAIAEVRDFDPSKYLGDKGLRSLDRLTKLLVVATRLAMVDAGLKKEGAFVGTSAERVGVVCSNAYGSLEAITELDRVAVLEDARYINPAKFPNTVANSASGYASIWEDLRALNVAISDGNCGGLDAVACADIYLETDRADALLVGGAEASSEALYLAFLRLGVFEAGGYIGEGAALIAVEEMSHAKARNAKIYAQILGVGNAFDAPKHEGQIIHASRDAVARATRHALDDAGIQASEVDLVVSGLSALRPFDMAETAGITEVLGADVPIAAPKLILGETLGAGGAMAMATALAWFQGTPPSAIVRGVAPAPGKLRTVLCTAMGYYGNATSVVLRG